jgi:23S rRNA (uracil1939-C5)-methyltransferase
VPAPAQLHYRTKVTLAVRGDRLGYRRLHEPDSIFDVRTCLIAEPAVQQLIDGMRTARRHLPPNATRVVLQRDRDQALHVVVRTDEGGAWTGGPAMHRTLAGRGLAVTIWWQPEGGAARAVAGSSDPWPVTVFEQVHPAMGRMVRAAALDALGEVSGHHVWDLYAGIGETTAALLARGATVESVERDRRAVGEAERIGPAGARRVSGAAEEVIGSLRPPSRVITNPPRTGMAPEVVDALAASGAERIVYVSCDPATLARDVARMKASYRVASLTTFDQFPQTAHLESVAVLERA